MAGSLRQRGEGSWQLRVHAGRDRETGRKTYLERTFRGSKRQAERALAALVLEAESLPASSKRDATVENLLREWLAHAALSFSPKTTSVTRAYVETTIVPSLSDW